MLSRILVDVKPLRRYPLFRRAWIGYAFRLFGAQFTVTTVVYQVYEITHSNLAVGLISIAQVVPGVIAPIFGSAIADAVDRRRLLVYTAVLFCITTTGLALNCIGNHPALWVLFVCSGVTWGLNGIDAPVRTVVFINLVDRESYIAVNVLRLGLSQLSQVAGPAVAGLLIAQYTHNLDIVYWVDVVATAVALLLVLRLPTMPSSDGGAGGMRAVADGFRFLRQQRVIQANFITDINATLLGQPTALYPYMALVHFHGGAKTFGLLVAAPAIGAVIGGLLSGWTAAIRYQGRAVMIAVVIWGIAIAGFGFSPWLWLGVVLLAISGWANAVSALMRNTILQVVTPDHLRGRLTSLSTISFQIGRLGNAESGIVAALSTAQVSIISGGLGCIVGVIVIARLIPSYARFRLDEQHAGNAAGTTDHR